MFDQIYAGINAAGNHLKKQYGELDKNQFAGYLPGGASREAASEVRQKDGSIGAVMQRGAIPVPTIIPAIEGGAKFVKSWAGEAGRPFDIQPAIIGRKELFDDELSRSTIRQQEDGTITASYGTQDDGYKNPQGILEQGERGIKGQWTAVLNPKTGDFEMREGDEKPGVKNGPQPYDSNRKREWHLADAANKFSDVDLKTGEKKDRDILGGILSKYVYAPYAQAQAEGKINLAPQGTQFQTVGNIKDLPAESLSNIQGLDKIFDNIGMDSYPEIETSKTEAPKSSGSYTVGSGDTLTAIAAANNTTVEELARKNNISDINMINVGASLKL